VGPVTDRILAGRGKEKKRDIRPTTRGERE